MGIEIITEIGINHNGDLNKAKHMIQIAKDCGADTAKFQLYDPKKLLSPGQFHHKDWEAILLSELNCDDIIELYEHCSKVGIEFLCSAFDYERLSWLEGLGVKRHKIASRTIYDIGYVKAIQNTNKLYFASLGMINEEKEEFDVTYKRLNSRYASFLYCVSMYPTPLACLRFSKDMFDGYYDGFSDHTIGVTAVETAIVLGAKIIEKHFTLDRSDDGPDHFCSIIPSELKQLCIFRDEFEMINIAE